MSTAALPIAEKRLRARQAYARRVAHLRRQVLLREHTFDQLGPAADRRCITIEELANRLLEVIADDDLVDSILDDEVPN